MEYEFKIPIPNTSLRIYAKQYGGFENPVVIFVHGLTGHMDEHLFYNGARYFYTHGISSVRFNLYGAEDDARDLVDCTLQTHAQDLNQVITYLHEKRPLKLFAVGHSYGGPTILHADHSKLDAVVFWDASYNYRLVDALPITGTTWRYMDWGVSPLIGDAMYQEAQAVVGKTLLQSLTSPLKVITAGKSHEARRENYDLAKEPKAYHTVQNASHTFTEEGVAEELFEESVTWLKKFR